MGIGQVKFSGGGNIPSSGLIRLLAFFLRTFDDGEFYIRAASVDDLCSRGSQIVEGSEPGWTRCAKRPGDWVLRNPITSGKRPAAVGKTTVSLTLSAACQAALHRHTCRGLAGPNGSPDKYPHWLTKRRPAASRSSR